MEKIDSISVVIPAFNAEKTIINSLHSVLDQTFLPAEIIVINDGSTDNTESIVSAFFNTQQIVYPQIQFNLITVPNGGVSKARNLGIEKASGDYIAFLDSDDTWKKEKLEKQIKLFRANENLLLVSTGSTLKPVSNTTKFYSLQKLLWSNKIVTSSVLLKSSIAKELFFDTRLSSVEDFHLWLRIAHKSVIALIDEELTVYAKQLGYGISGLSGNIDLLYKNELLCFAFLRKDKILSFFQYLLAVSVTNLRYIRRKIITQIKGK